MGNCIFCSIIKKEIPSYVIFGTDRILCFLDAFPMTSGHMLVVPKDHYEFQHELPDSLANDLILSVKKAGELAVTRLGVSDYNVLCNNGPLSGQAVPHVHFHIIPRTADDSGPRFKSGDKRPDNYYTKTRDLLRS